MVLGVIGILVLGPKTTIIRFDAFTDGALVGHSICTWRTREDGGQDIEVDGPLTIKGMTMRGVLRSSYRKDGRPLSSEFRRASDPDPTYTERQTFDAKTVLVEKLSKGEVTASHRYPVPANAVLIDPSRTWFSKRTPKMGEEASYSSMSNEGVWTTVTRTYRGRVSIAVKDKQVRAHYVDGSPKVWYDDQGYALRTDFVIGGVTVVLARASIRKL